jgi:hypothetical protein
LANDKAVLVVVPDESDMAQCGDHAEGHRTSHELSVHQLLTLRPSVGPAEDRYLAQGQEMPVNLAEKASWLRRIDSISGRAVWSCSRNM